MSRSSGSDIGRTFIVISADAPVASANPAVDIEIGYRTAALCILGNLSYILGRKLVWDGERERVIGDEQANRLLSRPQRYPYCL